MVDDNSLASGGATVPEWIGPYRVLQYLGAGAMGDVFLAERKSPMRQLVALKVIKRGMDTSTMLKRFASERQSLAIMEHHNIAKVYDAGETPDGRPYFAMEYIKGTPITHYCDEHRLDLRERLELFRQVCAGVQHAHQKGVMHRDLKPSNVLVAIEDDRPVPKIIDFGLARATDRARFQESVFTEHGTLIGTLEYMAPEQAGLDNLDIDTRADIYSLGVMLYELLVGTLPFPGHELRRAGELEVRRIIREVEPPRPSNRLSQLGMSGSDVARLRSTQTSTLMRHLRTDLDRVVSKAMAKERKLRYGTPSELAEDLRRFLDHEPVLAAELGALYRVHKFARRYRVQCTAAALVFLAMAGGTVGTAIGMRDATLAQGRAEASAKELARSNRFLGYVAQLQGLLSRRPELAPAWPRNLLGLRRWLVEAEALHGALPDIAEARAELELARMQGGEPEADSSLLLDSLRLLQRNLEEFAVDGGPLTEMRRDLAWAETIEARSIEQHRERWREAQEAIRASDGVRAHEWYDGFDLQPQMGLVPLGRNPRTRLWEFYDLRSAAPDTPIPFEVALASEGPPDPAWGIVFVLVPGRECWLGAQNSSRDEPNYDEAVDKLGHQLALERVKLRPFFLARYELTKLHWLRLAHGQEAELVALPGDPRYYHDPSYRRVRDAAGGQIITGLNPVEWVSWEMSTALLARHGLVLPSERQWEFACRGGTDTPWFTGADPASMAGYGNFADQAYLDGRGGGNFVAYFNDGHYCHAPVGSYKPNPFGLYDMLGNVFEVTTDLFDRGDAVVARGGSWQWEVIHSRCAYRGGVARVLQAQTTGLRAARAVE